jgi:RNA polymerase sigma-70 factor (ECF subfamily)
MDLKEEKKLIHEAQKNPELFGEIFEKYYQQVFYYTLKRTGQVELAEDLTSEIFFKALNKLWQFRFKNVPFSAWLYKIAGNEINYYFRKNKHPTISLDKLLLEAGIEFKSSIDLKQELIDAEKKLENHQNFLLIQKSLQKLPLKYQETLALKFFEHKKIHEIAKILQKSEGTVKSLLARGMELLKKEVLCQKLSQQFSKKSITILP